MAVECTQEAILDFVKERGGKVKNTDLIEHFKTVFPEEPGEKATVRKNFKNYVDNVAFVKSESGVKYVCLKKKFRGEGKEQSLKTETEPEPDFHEEKVRYPGVSQRAGSGESRAGDDVGQESALPRAPLPRDEPSPGSGYGNDSQVRVPHAFPAAPISQQKAGEKSHEFVCVVEDSCPGEMGNRQSFRRDKRESRRGHGGKGPDIPDIAVIEASPLPKEGSAFTLPEAATTGTTGQVAAAGLSPTEPDGPKEAEISPQRRQPEWDGEDQLDLCSLSGSEGTSPKSSRKHFIEVMMSSSPQVRRSMVLRSSVHLSSRSDSDSVSLVSCNLDDDRASVTLDPLEHEWMMCASDGEWGGLHHLLTIEPSLILRKDFVTGFTCLHWAAKHGKPELIALIINFAKQHNVPVSVDVRSNTGYTPLHIAAMHNHMEVVKLLVGAYNADVEIRDYSGRKACQYLTDNVSVDIRDIIGVYDRSESENADCSDGGRWRFSKVLQTNLKPLRLLSPNDCDAVDGEVHLREKPLRRKSSFSRMKPKLQRLRVRTSQIVHSTTFRDTEELEGSVGGSFRARPKTHFFW